MDKKEKKYLPIIGFGENLIEPAKKRFTGAPTNFPISFQEAKKRIKSDIKVLKEEISHIPENKKMDDVVIAVRLHEKFLAKSYVPNSLFRESNFENVGSRRWRKSVDGQGEIISKMHFVKLKLSSLDTLDSMLDKEENELTKIFKEDVRKLEKLSLLDNEEVMQGFWEEWDEGSVEFVLHPFGEENHSVISKFTDILKGNGVSIETLKVKEYHDGPIFMSAFVEKKVISEVLDFNPLRTVHPIKVNLFPELRSYQNETINLIPPKGDYISPIKVGVFDGGIDESHPFLLKFSKENETVQTQPIEQFIKHGTQVAGVVLYGNLKSYSNITQLEDPVVFVESFRVFPKSDPADFDLYEAIDIIEEIVSSRNDIDVYNLSFGPVGPIFDDEVSRFTYSLDRLAWNYRKLFVVAVGNDGHRSPPYNRVQAPSDMVNGLGIGAFTFDANNGGKIRAYYSSVGEGREGCKVKPDLCAFGGDENFPIHLLSLTGNKKEMSAGTSFSSPIVSGKAAEIIGRCNQFNALSARAILIHAANHSANADVELGYGILDQEVDEILECDENKVTIVYSASINPTGIAKLPIPLPLNSEINGNISISWTIATLSKANALHVEDYTESAIVDTFYPNSNRYTFSKGKLNKVLHLESDATEITKLMNEGWNQSLLPASNSPKKYQNEQDGRSELKWDTVVKKWKRMRSSSLENPFLIIHGMGRNGSFDRMEYSAVVTISAEKYAGNLYEDILNEYAVLQPVSIRSRNEILLRLE